MKMIFGFIILGVFLPSLVIAQDVSNSGIAEYTKISFGENQEGQNGQIVVYDHREYLLTSVGYHPDIRGVIVFEPSLAVSYIGRGENIYPLASSGVVSVQVTASNGDIEIGDFVTTSPIEGVGMKATQAGFMLGVAQASYSAENNQIGSIPVALNIKFATSLERAELSPRAIAIQFQDALTVGAQAFASEPNAALRYLAAAITLIASIAFGFLVFGRAATNGIVAVGRNPLARRSIFAMVIFNLSMTFVFAGIGITLALVIMST